ncbi:MAG: FliM/FliN family flagellar motor switch protein [Planctomycetota bacterium]
MTRNVSEQEIDALLARPEAPRVEVEARDFREPRWLSPDDLAALGIRAKAAGSAVVDALRPVLPRDVELEHTEVAEDSLESARARRDESLVLVCDGPAGPSLALMDRSAALQLVELALGGGEPDPSDAPRTSARRLTPFEAGLVERLLGTAFTRVAQAFGSSAKDPRIVSDSAELERRLPRDGDERRVAVRVALGAGTHKLVLHVLLAGIAPEPRKPATGGAPRPAAQAALPARIASTRVEVSAVLCELEIMLTDLLALEAGDLIPLPVTPGDPVEVRIEGELCGRATFGACADRLAVRMTEIQKPLPSR